MRSKSLLLGSFIALLAVPAMAQGNNAINLVGTVDKVDASSITVKMEESTETVKIAPNVLYPEQAGQAERHQIERFRRLRRGS